MPDDLEIGEPVVEDEAAALRLIAHRCPGAADFVVPVSKLAQVLDIVDALVARHTELSNRAEGLLGGAAAGAGADLEPATAEDSAEPVGPPRPRHEGFTGWPGAPGG
jgi:hypothetical protein